LEDLVDLPLDLARFEAPAFILALADCVLSFLLPSASFEWGRETVEEPESLPCLRGAACRKTGADPMGFTPGRATCGGRVGGTGGPDRTESLAGLRWAGPVDRKGGGGTGGICDANVSPGGDDVRGLPPLPLGYVTSDGGFHSILVGAGTGTGVHIFPSSTGCEHFEGGSSTPSASSGGVTAGDPGILAVGKGLFESVRLGKLDFPAGLGTVVGSRRSDVGGVVARGALSIILCLRESTNSTPSAHPGCFFMNRTTAFRCLAFSSSSTRSLFCSSNCSVLSRRLW
jgi:hypothetical protein